MAKRKITLRPGSVYFLYGADDAILYVGMTTQDMSRLKYHARVKDWWPEVQRAEFKHYPTEYMTRRAESHYIELLNPRYNIVRAAKTCTNCLWVKAKAKGLCMPCYQYQRTHGRPRPEEVYVAHARRVEEREAPAIYRWQGVA